MRILILIGAMASALLLGLSPSGAREYPWCQTYSNNSSGGESCTFVTFEQCLATIYGNGGFCVRNPRYQETASPRRQQRRNRD